MEDYRLSNDYFNIPSASKYAYQLPARSQEAITTLFSAREDFLNAAIEEMERLAGTVRTVILIMFMQHHTEVTVQMCLGTNRRQKLRRNRAISSMAENGHRTFNTRARSWSKGK